MQEAPLIDVFEALFAVAWADGELQDEERNFLADLVERTSVEEAVTRWFDEPPSGPDWEAFRRRGVGRAILLHATVVAAADDVVTFEETQLLDKVAKKLGFDATDLHQIQREVEEARAGKGTS